MPPPVLHESVAPPALERIGLIAGEGDFPLFLARAARSRNIHVTAIGITDITSPRLEREVNELHWISFGQFNRLIELCHHTGIRKAVMAGRIRHNSIFQLTKFDLRGIKLLARTPRRTADALLGAVTDELARENIQILDSTLFLRECMPPSGLLTPACPPSSEIQDDLDFGRPIITALAGMDVGQTLVVKNGTIVAVEAMEGTNRTILRGGEVGGEGCMVIKVNKPLQDKRFDVPVLGLTTIKKLIQARCRALAFPGGEVIFFDLDESVALAQSRRIAIIAW